MFAHYARIESANAPKKHAHDIMRPRLDANQERQAVQSHELHIAASPNEAAVISVPVFSGSFLLAFPCLRFNRDNATHGLTNSALSTLHDIALEFGQFVHGIVFKGSNCLPEYGFLIQCSSQYAHSQPSSVDSCTKLCSSLNRFSLGVLVSYGTHTIWHQLGMWCNLPLMMALRGFRNRTNSVVACVANGRMIGGKMSVDSPDDRANICSQFVLLEHSLHGWTLGSTGLRLAESTCSRSEAKTW